MIKFEEEKLEGLLELIQQEKKSSRKKIKLEFNKEYIANAGNAVLEKNGDGYPVIIITYKIYISNDQIADYSVRYPLTDTSRTTKMYELSVVLWALREDKYTICSQSSTNEELLNNIVNSINSRNNVKILFKKEGKPTYFKYEVKRYEEETSNE